MEVLKQMGIIDTRKSSSLLENTLYCFLFAFYILTHMIVSHQTHVNYVYTAHTNE